MLSKDDSEAGNLRDDEEVRSVTRAQASVGAAEPSAHEAVQAEHKADDDGTCGVADKSRVVVRLESAARRHERGEIQVDECEFPL